MFNNYNHIFFIGIGGISMSGLAEISLDKGFTVSGSDMNNSELVQNLRNKGATIYIGHNKENIKDCDLVVYTSAINGDNPEYIRAKELNIDVMDRAQFLGKLMSDYSETIAISGTHGKTTTTGMVSSILTKTNLDPTILIGGDFINIGGNTRIGSNHCLITEACEYKRNFLKFNPTIGVILNIDEDHLDYYKDITDIELAFKQFGNKITSSGTLVVNNKYTHLFNDLDCNIVTYGLDDNSDVHIKDLHYTPYPCYTVVYKNKEIKNIELKVFGMHNILNSLAAITACLCLNVSSNEIIDGLNSFIGVKRRYEVIGNYNNALLIDDYAHHPTAINATLTTAKNHTKGKIITIFQPHTFSRTYSLLDKFAKSFELSDLAIVIDIYPAREKDTGLVHSKDLVKKMKSLGINSIYTDSLEKAAEIAKNNISVNDTVLTVGAGSVYKVMEYIKK